MIGARGKEGGARRPDPFRPARLKGRGRVVRGARVVRGVWCVRAWCVQCAHNPADLVHHQHHLDLLQRILAILVFPRALVVVRDRSPEPVQERAVHVPAHD